MSQWNITDGKAHIPLGLYTCSFVAFCMLLFSPTAGLGSTLTVTLPLVLPCIRLVPSQLANSLGLNKWIETMASTAWSIQNLDILVGIFSLDIPYLEGKSPLLMRNIQVNFGDILPEIGKSSGFWDMAYGCN